MSRGRGRRASYPTSWQGRRNADPRRQADAARAAKQGAVMTGIEGPHGVTEFDEQSIGLCPCGRGYVGHHTLSDLRTPSLRQAYPLPRRYPDLSAVIYCPLCACSKSGDIEEPNTITEQCDAVACLCHQEEDPK